MGVKRGFDGAGSIKRLLGVSTPTSRNPPHWSSDRRSPRTPERLKGGGAMSHAQQILETHPRTLRVEIGVLAACIDWCFDCAQSCTACADADLGEPDVETLIACISLCRNCSDICTSTGKVLSRQTEFVPELARVVIQACIETCRRCGDECERHARHHEHCRVCAETCRRCEQACEDALAALPT